MDVDLPFHYDISEKYVMCKVLCEALNIAEYCKAKEILEPIVDCIQRNNGILSECTHLFEELRNMLG